MCNCIHELLNVFEDSAQHVHTIVGIMKISAFPPSFHHDMAIHIGPKHDTFKAIQNVFDELLQNIF